MKKFILVLLVAATLTAPLVALPAGASSQPEDDSIEVQYAESYGVTVEEAERRLKRIDKIKKKMSSILETEGDRVAGWGVDHSPNFEGWILLAGDEAPSARSRRIDRRTSDLRVDVGATHTFEELEAAMDDPDLVQSLPGAATGRIGPMRLDMRANALVVTISETASPDLAPLPSDVSARIVGPAPAMNVEELRTEVSSAMNAVSTVKIEVEPGDFPSTGSHIPLFGGQHIRTTTPGGTLGDCTTAFGVRQPATGFTGFVTAGHCGNRSGLDPNPLAASDLHSHVESSFVLSAQDQLDIRHAVTVRDSVWGDHGDFLWYTVDTSITSVTDDFYTKKTRTRDLRGRMIRADMIDEFVCHYGVRSGKSCGQITDIKYDPNWIFCTGGPVANGCSDRWIRIEGPTLEGCRGDSGGPVHKGRVAIGIYSGQDIAGSSDCTAAGTGWIIASPLGDALRAFDLELLT